MRHDDPAGRRPRGPGQDRLPDGRGRVRVAVEQPGITVREELAAVVDQEERRVARDLGGEVRRVVDRDDERIRGQPLPGHHLAHRPERGRRHDDVGIPHGGTRVGGERDLADPRPSPVRPRPAPPPAPGGDRTASTRRPAARDPAPPGGCGPGHPRRSAPPEAPGRSRPARNAGSPRPRPPPSGAP